MIATALWQREGEPVVSYAMDFSDVARDAHYAEAVRWAAAEKIVSGTGYGAFEPDAPVSREQLAVMLYRYAQHKGMDVSVGEDTNILDYNDMLQWSQWAVPALQWAVGAGVLADQGGNLNAWGTVTQAQADGILRHFQNLTAVIGIAWRADTDSEFFTNICRAVEAAGGRWVMLDQVFSPDLTYNDMGRLMTGVAETGALDETGAKYVRCNTWQGSNAGESVGSVSAVLFTGGEDISPTLYYTPEVWHGIEAERDYNAERDVSDYLTMTYCLDHDIPVMGFCRGMQMLSVVSGGEVIQDIPTYFTDQSLEYHYEHRNEKAAPDSYRDYAPHAVTVAEGSRLYDMAGTSTLSGCPSWHHQAVKSVDNTRLTVTGYTDTNGIPMIEAVERTDKTFAVGLQFHPEAALVKHLDKAGNEADYMDYDTALSIFRYLVEEVHTLGA